MIHFIDGTFIELVAEEEDTHTWQLLTLIEALMFYLVARLAVFFLFFFLQYCEVENIFARLHHSVFLAAVTPTLHKCESFLS